MRVVRKKAPGHGLTVAASIALHVAALALLLGLVRPRGLRGVPRRGPAAQGSKSGGMTVDVDWTIAAGNEGTLESRPVGQSGAGTRPAVPRAAAAVGGVSAKSLREPQRPKDMEGPAQEDLAATIRSLVRASAPGADYEGSLGAQADDRGRGAGPALGGGPRGQALGEGEGNGEAIDFFTQDPRLVSYFRLLHERIDPLWAHAFPKSAVLDLRQGTVILLFTVYANGQARVGWPPMRPSGFPEFDRNCANAIRRAAPFPPIPASLGVERLTIRAPFVVSNPLVK